MTKPDLSERPAPIVPADDVLANLLRTCPEMVFKYQTHDSLLEKEDDLTEEEKAVAWAKYVKEAKTLEAKLALEKLLLKPQEASSFFDSDAEFSDNDPLWDEVNGNDLEESPATVCDRKDLFRSELPEPGPSLHKPSLKSIENGQGTVRSSPVLEIDPNHSQFATYPPIPQAGRVLPPPPKMTSDQSQFGAKIMIPSHKITLLQNRSSANLINSAASIAPTCLSLAQNVPSHVPFVIRQPAKAIPSQSRFVAQNQMHRPGMIQMQIKPTANTIKNAVGITPTLLPLLKTKPSQTEVATYLQAKRTLFPRLENIPIQNKNVAKDLIPRAGVIEMQHKPSMNTIENAAGNDCAKVATHPSLPMASTSQTQHKLPINMVVNAQAHAASLDSFPENEPIHGQVKAHATVPRAGKY